MEGHGRGDLAAYYSGLLEEQEKSGLSMAEFAEDVGISSATLYSWRRRLGTGASRPKLVEVHLAGRGREPEAWAPAMTLVVGDRFRLELSANFDEEALERVLGVLVRC